MIDAVKSLLRLCLGVLAGAPAALEAQDIFDRIAESLSFATADGTAALRFSGLADLEAYRFDSAAPGFIGTSERDLINPRLTVFADVQFGIAWYGFAQARWDRGFDPAAAGGRVRLDEYVVRFTPGAQRRFAIQAGKFATIVGNWTTRHDSWRDPFITAPLPYGGSTPIWDNAAVVNRATLFNWSYADRPATPADRALDPQRRLPVIWGPAYALGAAVSGTTGRFDWALELKNAALAARPAEWRNLDALTDEPAWSGRLGYRPNPTWSFGASASSGAYLRPGYAAPVPAEYHRGDYRQEVAGLDAAFAWRHWQVWAEGFAVRFTIPEIGDAKLVTGYVEARYKFTPRFSAALRVNRQEFDTLPDPSGRQRRWGHDGWRTEFAPAFRFTPNVQLKLQWSVQREDDLGRRLIHDTAAQLTVRF